MASRADAVRVLALQHEQQHVPCHLHALGVLRRALAARKAWIRVDKPDHVCEFATAVLQQQVRDDPLGTPRCVVNLPEAEQARLGTVVEPWRPLWPGISLT